MECLICGKVFDTAQALGCHLKEHNITANQYKERFGLISVCRVCGCRVSKKSKKGYCNKCRPRSGEDNPFYGKTHSQDTINKIKEKNSKISSNLWRDDEYRQRVVNGATGVKRSDEFKNTQRMNAHKQFDSDEQRDIRRKKMKDSWDKGLIPTSKKYNINRSKKEKELFSFLINALPDHKVERKTIRIDKKWLFPDIIIDDLVIVEYNGDYWHCNPLKYDASFVVERIKKTAKEIWDKDRKRLDLFTKNGYIVIVVWESDYKRNKELVISSLCERIRGML